MWYLWDKKTDGRHSFQFIFFCYVFFVQYSQDLFIVPSQCAHVVNRLLHENWKSIPKFLSGKKLLKNVTILSQ